MTSPEETTSPSLEPGNADRPLSPGEAIDVLCTWLRIELDAWAQSLRSERPLPRTELDALLEPHRPLRPTADPPIPATVAELARRLELREDEVRVVAVLAACAFEPSLGRALGLLTDPLGRPLVTWSALVRFLGLPRTRALTGEDATVRLRLVRFEGDGIALDPTIASRLAGRVCRDPELIHALALVPLREPFPCWPVDELARRARQAIASGARGVRIWLRGPSGSGRRTLFASIAEALGLRAASFDGVPESLRTALRLALLDDLALIVSEPVSLPSDLPMPILLGWLAPEPPPHVLGVWDLAFTMPRLDRTSRRVAWERMVPAFGELPPVEQARLVEPFAPTPGKLAAVALSGERNPEAIATLLTDELIHRMAEHAEVLDTPFAWDDLLVPPPLHESLRELAFEARTMPRLFDDPALARLFPSGRSVLALFTGPPGTGKTMAAQVVARAIGLPLFRIDLSRMISKYIGETSQHLARLLEAARETDAILFFDEADALFGKRTDVQDAHDRYANTDTDYLLQALDAWRGIAILATNKKGNIDPAFLRRMRTILEFHRPDAKERRCLWDRLSRELLPAHEAELAHVLPALSEQLDFSGAQIKAALVTARIAGESADAPVAIERLLRGIERELAKEGRGLSPRDRKRLFSGSD